MCSRKKRSKIPFTPFFKDVINCQAWKELSMSEQLLYMHLKVNYNGSNNGKISLTYENLSGHFSKSTIASGFKGLIDKGWIEKTRHGGLYRYYCLYRLTLKYDRVFKSK